MVAANFSQFSNLLEFRISGHNRAIDILNGNYDKSISASNGVINRVSNNGGDG